MSARAAALLLVALACAPAPVQPPSSTPPARAEVVVDVREPDVFAAGHVPGALNLQWGWSQLEHRVAAYVPDPSTPLRVVAPSGADRARAVDALREAGYTDVVAWAEPTDRSATLPVLTAAELWDRLAAGEALVVLDVRTPAEWADGTIEGAVRLEQDEAPARAADLDRDARYAVICEAGYRSGQLASWMQREGFADVANVLDGMAGWRALDE